MPRTNILLLSALFALVAAAFTASSASASIWLVNGAEATGQEVTLSGGTFVLTAAGKTITCTSLAGKGTVTGGTDNASEMKFTGCTTNLAGCLVKTSGKPNGTIVLANVPTELGEFENHTAEKILGDRFRENATTKELGTLFFEPESGKSCTGFTTTKIKGAVTAEVDNAAEELIFPNAEFKGNTLEAFGSAARLTGDLKLTLAGGGVLQGQGGVEKVWYVKTERLYKEVVKSRELIGPAELVNFVLEEPVKLHVKITCTNGKNVETETGSIRERNEINAEWVFENCTVKEPKNCELLSERKGGVFVIGILPFKALEGKLSGDVINFREEKLGTPLASFKLTNEGANNCAGKGAYKLTGTFTALLRNPETEELEKKLLLSDGKAKLTLQLTNEAGEHEETLLQTEIGVKLKSGEKWKIGPA